jgi:protein-L-isoaspartate(D-aspartate) O-methyltransferase
MKTYPSRAIFPAMIVLLLTTIVSLGSVASAQSRMAFEKARQQMVDKEIVAAGVKNPRVIESMRSTPRHEFVSLPQRKYAYLDMALPIGESQTISPPFVVAYMTESLDPKSTDKVLEIGTGSGYQAAVLSPLVRSVYSIEIVAPLGRQAARTLRRLHYDNVYTKIGDGYKGWPEHAPFDKIIITCSPERVPSALVAQLKEGGMMVIPVGRRYQQTLYLLKKVKGKLVAETLRPTLFVPMTGQAEDRRKVLPDPTDPKIVNGGFEKTTGKPPIAAAWHYQRQVKLISAADQSDDKSNSASDVITDDAPEGDNYVTFSNSQAGRGSQALQGFAVDGRKVAGLRFSLDVKGKGLRPGQNVRQMPTILITFYDARRATVGRQAIGDWRGSFGWQRENMLVPVPLKARESIVTIGLLGAVGEISFDNIVMKAVKR